MVKQFFVQQPEEFRQGDDAYMTKKWPFSLHYFHTEIDSNFIAGIMQE